MRMRTILFLAAAVLVSCSSPPAAIIDPAPTPQDLQWPTHVGICKDVDGNAVACLPLTEYAMLQAELARAQSWIRQASYVLRDECGIETSENPGRVAVSGAATNPR